MGNAKTPHTPSTHIIFHDVSLGDIIKDISHQSDFGGTNHDPSNVDTTGKDNSTHDSVNDAMILTNISKRYNVSSSDIRNTFSSSNPFSTQELKAITIDGRLYLQFNTPFIHVFNHNLKHFQSLVYWGDNGLVYGK